MERPLSAQVKSNLPNDNEALKDVIQDIIDDNQKIFGIKSKPRNQDPSMQDLMKWDVKEPQPEDFGNPKSEGYQKFKTKINKSINPYTTENKDAFRQYHFDKSRQLLLPYYQPEEIKYLEAEKQKKVAEDIKPDQVQNLIQQQYTEEVKQQYSATKPVADLKKEPKITQYDNDFSLKKIGTEDELKKKIINNVIQLGKSVADDKTQSNVFTQEEQKKLAEEQAQVQIEEAKLAEQYQEQQAAQQIQVESKKPKTNYKQIKSRLLSYKKEARKLDPVYEKERLDRRKDRIKQLEETTRWLPNSAFSTYFGKPAFENYGMKNVKPTIGGMIYGQYLLSHNVNPHKGERQPEYVQTFNNALDFADRLPVSEPQPPRKCKDEFRLGQQQVQELKQRNQIFAKPNKRGNLGIIKPDLVNSLRFASEEDTPTKKKTDEERRQQILQEMKNLKQSKQQQKLEEQAAQKVSFEKVKNEQIPSQSPLKEQASKQNVSQIQQSKEVVPETEQVEERKFMEELNKKKERSNRLASKITDADPKVVYNYTLDLVRQRQQSKENKNNQQQNKQIEIRENLPPASTSPQKIDDMNPPKLYLQSLNTYELDPKCYKNIPPEYLKRIPYAGYKKVQDKEL